MPSSAQEPLLASGATGSEAETSFDSLRRGQGWPRALGAALLVAVPLSCCCAYAGQRPAALQRTGLPALSLFSWPALADGTGHHWWQWRPWHRAPTPASPEYDEEEAKAMVYFAAAAYDPQPQTCFEFANLTGYKVLDNTIVDCPAGFGFDEVAKCAGFVACKESSTGTCDHIVLSFRGSQHFNQMRAELTEYRTLVDMHGLGKVGAYYWDVFNKLNATVAAVTKAARDCNGCRITATGHSMGGGVASIAAVQLAQTLERSDIELYTFGQPRIGNCAWARHHDELVPQSFRVVHGVDIVPHLPTCQGTTALGDLECSCDVFPSSEALHHHGTEVWYQDPAGASFLWRPDHPEAPAPRVCLGEPLDEDRTCSNSRFQSRLAQYWHLAKGAEDHLHYFDIFVGKFCLPGYH